MCFLHCTFIYLLLRSPGRPTAANDGQLRPTKTKKGHKSQPRVVRHHVSRLQHTHHTFGPDDAHEGLRRPPAAKKANPGPRRGKRAQRYLRYVFFSLYIYLFITTKPGKAHSSQRRPTQANEGQCRPTKTKKGPNDARRVAWAPGKFFFFFLRFIDNESPQQPTTANAGHRRPTKANAGPQRRKRAQTTPGASLGP